MSPEDSNAILTSIERRLGRLSEASPELSLTIIASTLLDYADALAAAVVAEGHAPQDVSVDLHIARFCILEAACGRTVNAHNSLLQRLDKLEAPTQRWWSLVCQLGQLVERDRSEDLELGERLVAQAHGRRSMFRKGVN